MLQGNQLSVVNSRQKSFLDSLIALNVKSLITSVSVKGAQPVKERKANKVRKWSEAQLQLTTAQRSMNE